METPFHRSSRLLARRGDGSCRTCGVRDRLHKVPAHSIRSRLRNRCFGLGCLLWFVRQIFREKLLAYTDSLLASCSPWYCWFRSLDKVDEMKMTWSNKSLQPTPV